ncbi:Bax inhibitor-1 family protein [Ligilactobacillus aviarius]|uniref:Bax inhibitor-1 family protein n=1 Tax=Ligilactobacillus aviarius TaxID=1606 RepID=UPI0024BAF1D5|nr:Bax inhibitor-1 family protein [Ligilactobacillus aviarius]
MKSKNKYILAVYTTFSIELLINIATIIFCERNFDSKYFSHAILNQYSNILIIISALLGFIQFFIIEERIKNKKAGILSLLVLIPICLTQCIFIGILFAALALGTNFRIVLYAFLITFMIFLSMTIWGFLSKRTSYHHPILSRIFIGSCVVSVFNMFWGWSWINLIVDVIDLIVVSLFIYLDTIKIKQHAEKFRDDNLILKELNALMDAFYIYMDFALIWADVADLMARTEADSE